MTKTVAQGLIKDIVRRRIKGVWLDGEYYRITYHVARNRFYIRSCGSVSEYTRSAMVDLFTRQKEGFR